jgi:hypothetical protein
MWRTEPGGSGSASVRIVAFHFVRSAGEHGKQMSQDWILARNGTVLREGHRHGAITECPIANSEKIVLQYLAAEEDSEERIFLEKKYGKKNMLRLVEQYQEDQANKRWLEASTMACPGCEIHVEKSLGCNHVGVF